MIVKISNFPPRRFEFPFKYLDEKIEVEVYQISPSVKFKQFSGYQNVNLNYKELQNIINNTEDSSWKNALSNVKVVYVITDINTGKLYIGSASGNSNGLWQRWSEYADLNNLTVGNKDFIEILNNNNKGKNYIINNFKYSILEIFDTKVKQEYIIEREEYWKKVFETRKFGMNKN